MSLRSVLIALVLALLATFTLLNWTAFMAPTSLSLGFAQIQAPLGLIMLGVTAALCVLFLGYIVFQQAGVIREARRMSKELQSQRALADSAEASRFTELRAFVAAEMSSLATRLEGVEAETRTRIGESERSLAACIGEVEDKLDRLLPPPSRP
ncbi:MAG: LapA family protein [Piscinibacter sp.]|uniref:LapA family protein n=1 Tax=Piscinibacter sp. TaxID=1903157 RepID=UPI003D0DEBF9